MFLDSSDTERILAFIKAKFEKDHGANPPLGCRIDTPMLELKNQFALSYDEVCEVLLDLDDKGEIVLDDDCGQSLFLPETYLG